MPLFNNIMKEDLSKDQKIKKINDICSNNIIKQSDIKELVFQIINENNSNDIFIYLKIVTEKTLPDQNTITKILNNPYCIGDSDFKKFIDHIYDKGYTFTSYQLNKLLQHKYYIDPSQVIKINKQMFKFLFTKITMNNLNYIKQIMNKYQLLLDKKCFNNMLLNNEFTFEKKEIIKQYLNFFIQNNVVFNENDFCEIILKLYNTYYNNDTDSKKYEILQMILNTIYNGKITENIITKLLTNHTYIYKINQIIILLSIYFEKNPGKLIISNNNLRKLIVSISRYNYPNMIKFIFDNMDFVIDANTMEFIKLPELNINKYIIDLFEKKCTKNIDTALDSESQFIEYMTNCDIISIKKMIDNKFMPKVEYLYYLIPSNNITNEMKKAQFEIILIFINLNSIGLIINDEMYAYLYMIGIDKLDTLNFPNVSSQFKKNMNDKINANNISIYKIKDIENIQNIQYLRKLFHKGYINDILKYENSDSTIEPDEICFFNALCNIRPNVMKYVISKYNYNPSILDILNVTIVENRIYLFKRFYPNQSLLLNNKLTQLNNNINELNNNI
jgi:hypothetical protein